MDRLAPPSAQGSRLTAQPGTTVHVTINGDELTVASDAEHGGRITDEATSPDQVLEEAIRRLEKANISQHIRDAVDGLRGMGYALLPAETRIRGKRPENYLRIMDPEYTAHGIGYLTPGNFSFTRGSDRERLASQPGARTLRSEVAFSHVESAEMGLDVARLLKA
jgi:hypothetical protein